MRRSPWTLIFLLAAALLMLAVAQGCSSRRKSAPPAEVTPPPSEMPTIQRSRTPTPDEIKTTLDAIRKRIWNQNLASVVIEIKGDTKADAKPEKKK